METAAIEAKATNWIPCKGAPWYPNLPTGGLTAYRIHQQFDGMRWFQRHEWKSADGTTELEAWIPGVTGWLPAAA